MVTPQFFTDFSRARRTELHSLLMIGMNNFAKNWMKLRMKITPKRPLVQNAKKKHENSWVLKLNTHDQITQELYNDFKNYEVKMEMKTRKIHPSQQVRQRAHHSFMRGDEDLTLSTKKPVVLRSDDSKPVETTENQKLGLLISDGKLVARDSNENQYTVDPATGW